MKHIARKTAALLVCLFLLACTFKANAQETVTTVKNITLPSYLAPLTVSTVTAGDINGDGRVNNKDLSRLFQYLSEWDVDYVEAALDVNGDGRVNNKDLSRLFQYLSEWDVQIFPQASGCEHKGGIATCRKKAICELCGEEYGEFNPANHTGGTATYYQKAVCDGCGKEYGGFAQILAYDSLNENQKGMYNKIYEAIKNLDKKNIYLEDYADTAEQGESDISVAFRAVSYDKPECFWMPRSYRVGKTVNKRTGELIEIYVSFAGNNKPNGEYNVSLQQKEEMQSELDAVIDNILSKAQTYETDFDREVYIHDYLCRTVTYDFESASSSDPDFRSLTVYGALINGACVCEGYSRAMQLLCQRLNIPCGLVTGKYGSWDEETNQVYYTLHMWNIINPGEGCCYLDVTFDDLDTQEYPDLCTHYCFNMTKEETEMDHIFDEPFDPNENYSEQDTEYNFFDTHGDHGSMFFYTKRKAYITENNLHEVAAYINDLKSSGVMIADFIYDDEVFTPPEAMKMINRILVDDYGFEYRLSYGYGYYQNWMFILLVPKEEYDAYFGG